MSDLNIGKIIEGEAHRDAIHVAIAPVVSKDMLWPGQHVGLVSGTMDQVEGPSESPVGIVDPFLARQVFPGQRFYLFLYPNTVTSLKHFWTHPAFGAPEKAPEPVKSKVESEKWLREFCDKHDCPKYETVIAAINGKSLGGGGDYYDGITYDIYSDYFMFYGADAHSEIPPEFWDHVEVVTGQPQSIRPAQFSCSC